MDSGTYTNQSTTNLAEARLEELMAAWNELVPRVCCVACRREASWLDVEQHHWLIFRDEGRLYRVAQCLVPRFYERVEFRR
jgi:hypothetical protein